MSNRQLVLIIGIVAGLLFACLGGLLLLATGKAAPAGGPAAPPDGALIEAQVVEPYLSHTMVETTSADAGALKILDGRIDIKPNNRLAFLAQIDTPLGPMTTRGAVTIAVRDGRLAFRLDEVRLGQAPLTFLLAPFLPAIESQINEQANRQLAERIALAKVELLAVTSDETQLTFYLTGK